METGKKIFYLSPDTGKESGNISTPERGDHRDTVGISLIQR